MNIRHEHNNMVRALLLALDMHYPGMRQHSERVAVCSAAMGEYLELSERKLLKLRYAALLHDIGKACLDVEQIETVQKNLSPESLSLFDYPCLASLFLEDHKWMHPFIPLIRHSCEKWDGTGFPHSLSKKKIPLESRIIAVSDAFDYYVYYSDLESADAFKRIKKRSSTHYDPIVVRALEEVFPKIHTFKVK